MKEKLLELDKVSELIEDDMTIMVSGFMGCGSPHKIISLLEKSNKKNLKLICNDTGFPDYGVGKMVVKHQFSHIIASHIGLNPEAMRQLNEHETEFELVPQGTLAERIRSGGFGLGGVLTTTGLGTVVEEGKTIITVDGTQYILEKPLKADIAIIGAAKVDKKGNTFYRGTGKNFAPLMAMAANTVIVEADEIVEVGELSQEEALTPSILVDYIVDGGAQ